mmetsp:Transcript_2233/g.7167  ORF Transcript_2233/g.7167 Transcript_2233/m.7167 type:complete len:229 (-) Transcript_2233:1311-1997(-)
MVEMAPSEPTAICHGCEAMDSGGDNHVRVRETRERRRRSVGATSRHRHHASASPRRHRATQLYRPSHRGGDDSSRLSRTRREVGIFRHQMGHACGAKDASIARRSRAFHPRETFGNRDSIVVPHRAREKNVRRAYHRRTRHSNVVARRTRESRGESHHRAPPSCRAVSRNQDSSGGSRVHRSQAILTPAMGCGVGASASEAWHYAANVCRSKASGGDDPIAIPGVFEL